MTGRVEKLQKGAVPSTVFKNLGQFDGSLLDVSADTFELARAVETNVSLVPETTVSHNSCKSFNFSIRLLKKLQNKYFVKLELESDPLLALQGSNKVRLLSAQFLRI